MTRKIFAVAALLLVAAASVVTASGAGSVETEESAKEISILIPWQNANNLPPEDNWATIEYEKRTGVHIDWQVAPREGWQEQRGVVIASGDLPDAIAATRKFGGSHFSESELLQYGSQGVFVDLAPYIESHGDHLKRVLDENPRVDGLLKSIDGSLYALPLFQVCYHCGYSMKAWINVEWLDAVGLEMPTNTEELRQVLMAFKTQDPNGNGISDELPISSAINGWRTNLDGWLMTPFVYTDGEMRVFLDEEGQIQYSPAQPEYREGLRYIASLYSDGLISPETFTQDQGALTQSNLRGDEAIVGLGFGGANFLTLGDTSPKWREYEVLPPIEGPDGFVTAANFGATSFVQPGSFVVTSAAPDPGMIIEWVDWLFSSEADLFRTVGEEGVGWRRAEPGELTILGEQAEWVRLLSNGEIDNQNLAWGNYMPGGNVDSNMAATMAVQYADWRDAPNFMAGLEDILYLATQPYEAVAPPVEEVVPPFAVLPERVTDFSLLQTTITDYVVESFARFVTGQLDVESDWDQYIRRLDQLGLQSYLEMVQEGYDIKYGN